MYIKIIFFTFVQINMDVEIMFHDLWTSFKLYDNWTGKLFLKPFGKYIYIYIWGDNLKKKLGAVLNEFCSESFYGLQYFIVAFKCKIAAPILTVPLTYLIPKVILTIRADNQTFFAEILLKFNITFCNSMYFGPTNSNNLIAQSWSMNVTCRLEQIN